MPESEWPDTGRSSPTRKGSRGTEELRGRLRAHDPFELIRWLAFSQPDPRKALAELVQNSLDAGARTIRVSRVRDRGVPCLRIYDDGEGVIPEMERAEALEFIATHIGHSRKRDLSPRQRLDLMTQGQYGIGLLGFWSLGEMLEMRTVVPGHRPMRLVLYRDRSDFLIKPLRGRLPMDERWTEVVVSGLHREAMAALIGRRAADFLASELRGQLLSRPVDLVVEDRMSRGRAQKVITVRPPRFFGEPLEGLGPLEVPGHPPVRIEIYLSEEAPSDAQPRGISVYAAGTLVAESFHELAALGLDHAPWTDSRLSGLVDFPGFAVPPGSRRGIVPDEAAGAFSRAMEVLEPLLISVLASAEQRRSEQLDRTLVRELQRAFRDFYRQRPRYSLLPVQRERDTGAGPSDGGSASGEGGQGGATDASGELANTAAGEPAGAEPSEGSAIPDTPPPDLLPAGPLDSIWLTPSPLRVECRGTRRARATALDASGRPLEAPAEFDWRLEGPVGSLAQMESSPAIAILRAASEPAEGTLSVTARSEGREASAEVAVEVVEEIAAARTAEGIPEPEFLSDPAGGWRSRIEEERWQVNTSHRDYRAVADRPPLKLRYLASLFAKEVVLRSSQDPRLEKPLEQLIEIACYADRQLTDRRGGRRPRRGGTQE